MKQQETFRDKKKAFWKALQPKIEDMDQALKICSAWSAFADEVLKDLFQSTFQSDPIALFALGKLGSFELNLSSDVDLVFVCDQPTEELQRKVRSFTKTLQDVHENGFVFRVDYNLRPGGSSAPLLPSVNEYCDYYTGLGETWERIALYRMRPLAGNKKLIQAVKQFNDRFIFRKHLDYQVFNDVARLRERILSEKQKVQDSYFLDLKFTAGGIRDIELFLHSLVVIHGGRNSQLRKVMIPEIIDAFENIGVLTQEDAKVLIRTYRHLRFLENFVQYQDDQQTHSINTKGPHPKAVEDSLIQLQTLLEYSKKIVRSLLGDETTAANLDSLTKNFLSYLPTGEEAQQLGLSLFHDFLKAIEAKPSFYVLLQKETSLLKNLASLFSRSTYLSQILISRPELLDSFIFKRAEVRQEEWDIFLNDLVEKRLLSEIILGNQFLENQNLAELVKAQSSVADEICQMLVDKLNQEFQAETEILCLGKWGSLELGLASDLDFIFVTKEELRPAHHKIAQRFISRITERHRGGSLYSIDLRLKPQVGAGALVVTERALLDFLGQKPAAWIRQAYLRSRKLSSLESFEGIEAFINFGLQQSELLELSDIQNELYQKAQGAFDIKYCAGGLLDIELAFQAHLLAEKKSLGHTQKPLNRALKELGFLALSQIHEELRISEQNKTLLGSTWFELETERVQNLLSASRKELKTLDPRPRSS